MSDYLKSEIGDVKKKGFGIIPKLVMQDERLSIEAKAIYSYMASYAGAGDTAFPGVEKMKKDLGIGEKRFYSHRKQLIEYGFISVTKTRDGNRRGNNTYTLNQIIKSEHSQNDSIEKSEHSRFERIQNEHLQNECIQNGGANSNSILKTTVLKSNSIKKQHTQKETETKKEIEKIVCVLDKKINYSEAKKLLKVSGGDIDLIKEKYEVAKAIGYKNLMATMTSAIKENWGMPKEQEDKPVSKSNVVKTKFHNFEQRTSKYTPDELEKMVLDKGKNRTLKTK